MRVFVTGANGWVGSSVVKELLGAGHTVTGMVRSSAGAATVEAAGAAVVCADLDDLVAMRRAAGAADGVIHTAFNHDFSNFAKGCEQDRRAIEALGSALKGTTKPLVVTSGLALLASGRPALESDRPPAPGPHYPRASEAAADALVALGVHASVVRLAPSVHGTGDHGFVPMLINLAKEKGSAAYIGEGANRWAGVHRLDAARLFRLALEHGGIGERWHAVQDEGVPLRDIAAVIARRLEVPLAPLTPEQAQDHFGWMAPFAGIEMAASSARTREALGWAPRERTLLEDIEQGGYF
ncbi:SDR family oxidoreductase [Massilia sp. 9096]|uniref:SDR family oxidoreductase n=1 Tax=Massilia sp. 9096 TaxID=1500894 RepID=UPI00055B8629|nr:SDR family oxidoreductase [Massilia sp. 9096]